MNKIHHNTAKKAAAHKIALTVVEGEVIASTKDGARLASGLMGNKVLDEAIAKLGAPIAEARAQAKAAKKIAKDDDLPFPGRRLTSRELAGIDTPAKKKTPKKAKRVVKEDDEDIELDGEQDEDDAPEGKGMIKSKYKKIYKPFKMTNGDDLNQLLVEHLKYKDPEGKMRVNQAKLVKFAKANDCWVDGYKHLNVGQQRLNVGNRLRARIKKGHVVSWS